jgi:hypothetical protein
MPDINAPKTIAWALQVAANPVPDGVFVALSTDKPVNCVTLGCRESTKIALWGYGGAIIVSAPVPPAKEWHSFAYTYDGTTHRLYADGKMAGSSTAPAQVGPCKTAELGRWWEGSVQYYLGSLDDVRIYSRALSEQEIQALVRRKK